MCTKRTFHKYTGTQYVQSCNSRMFLKPFSSEYMNTYKYATIMSNLPIISYPEIIPELTALILRRESVTGNGPQQSIRTSPEVTPAVQESRRVTAIAGGSSQKEYEGSTSLSLSGLWGAGTTQPKGLANHSFSRSLSARQIALMILFHYHLFLEAWITGGFILLSNSAFLWLVSAN